MSNDRTYHTGQNPQTAADFPTIDQLWERMLAEVAGPLPEDKRATLKMVFLAGFACCLEIHMDIGMLPTEEEAVKVMKSYIREIVTLREQASADAARLMAEAIQKVGPNAAG